MERLHFSFYDPIPVTAPPNDDLELQLVWLHLVESAGATLTQGDFARAWRDHIHYMWDEYGRCRWNLRRGVPAECVGSFENPFHAGMGSPIRSEIWACLFVGDPESAAHYAAMDASLDHGIEGIAGEVFFAVMQSLVAEGCVVREAILSAQGYIPEQCETARAIRLVERDFESKVEPWEAREHLIAAHHSDNFTHAPLNVALTVWALLYGKDDFETTILLAVNGGYDTDCTAATAGATLGLFLGSEGIPQKWSTPIGDRIFIGPGIQGISAPLTVQELTDRTMALIGKMDRQPWSHDAWNALPPPMELTGLPGTISIGPLGQVKEVLWANGELPREVKAAGGAIWEWEVDRNVDRELMCLATEGAEIWIDDEVALCCPPGLPYVPAPHRCPQGSRVMVSVSPGKHRVRVELPSTNPAQQASVLLTYPNFHLCPWTADELPTAAELPA